MQRNFLFASLYLIVLCQGFKAIAQETPDSLRLNHLISYAHAAYLSNPDSAISTSHTVLKYALKRKSEYFEGYSYFILSKANWAKTNYKLSTEYGFKALAIFENSPFANLWGECLLTQGRSCIDLKVFSQARNFLTRAERLAIQHSDSKLLAGVYRERSFLFLEEQKYDSALYYTNKGLELYEKSKDTLHTSILYSRKARIYFSKRDFVTSMAFIRKSLVMDSLVNNKRALGISYFQAAQTLYYLQKTDSSILFLKKALSLNDDINNLITLIRAHDLLAKIYLDQKKPALASDQLILSSMRKDSLYLSEKNGHIQEMQALYALASKDKTIKMLEQEKVLHEHQARAQRLYMIFLVAGVLLLAAFILVLSRLRTLQSKVNKELTLKNFAIEHQKEEIHAQAENLQQLNHLKSKLFSVISHDLRGPISNLQALLELLAQKVLKPEEFLILSDKLKTNLNITQRTLENLLNWSLSQMEGIKTIPKAFDLKHTIDEVCKLVEEGAERKNIKVENALLSSVQVYADPDQVQLILRNLIHNAIKFSNADNRIVVSSSVASALCTVSVKDFGIGMTSEEIGTILNSQEFFSKNGTEQETGTGLGLILCKEFIHRNDGSMTIESRSGNGTQVSFTLPLA